MAPRLTVLIPTRERCDTLLWALKTCVTQDYDELEILVSDNASQDATREVVESYDDARIRYINPGRRLGMSEHWEFAVAQARAGYLSVIGDDDGLLPGAAAAAAAILGDSGADALTWPMTAYYWPRFVRRDLANHISLRVPRHRATTWKRSREVLDAVARFEAPYYELPSIYWGFVRKEVLDAAAARSGRLFWSITPDVYSGAATAAMTPRFLKTNVALSISGSSHHSNGAHQGMRSEDDAATPGSVYLLENLTDFHPSFDYSGSIPLVVAETLVQAREHVSDDVPSPDLRAMIAASLRHEHFLFNRNSQDGIIAALRSTATKNQLDASFDRALTRWNRQLPLLQARAALRNVLLGNPIHACGPDVKDIYGASLEAADLLNRVGSPVSADVANMRGRVHKVGAAARMVFARGRLSPN